LRITAFANATIEGCRIERLGAAEEAADLSTI
jgi:hypothetical protein